MNERRIEQDHYVAMTADLILDVVEDYAPEDFDLAPLRVKLRDKIMSVIRLELGELFEPKPPRKKFLGLF